MLPTHSPRLSCSHGLTAFRGRNTSLIPFCLRFQGIRDRLYQDPMEVQTPGQAFTAFLGALGFTRPVEQLVLRSVPLPSLLFWLSRPKGSNLVEATTPAEEVSTTSACRSMAIVVSEEMLYKDRCPLVGVGLVYTPPYLPQVPFSVAYMNLCEWRDAQEASENRLVGTRLVFIHASEVSGFLPVAEGHPVLLDASTTEVLGDIETSVSPVWLRGFQLHKVLVPLTEGSKARNIVSPRFQGGSSSALILYDEETVSPGLGPQPPMEISLCAPSPEHWTIVLDTVFPSTIEEYRRLREQAAAKPTEAEALPSSDSRNGAGGAQAVPSREQALQIARSILDEAHALQLRSMADLGRIRELDRTLARTLMAEFSRVQLIVVEDLRKSLVALRSDFLDSCSAFITDVARIMGVTPADPRSDLLRASLEVFQRQTSLRFDLPLAEMEAAEGDITTFMNARLKELSSQTELPELIDEAARLMGQHCNLVWQLVQHPKLGLGDVSFRVLTGLLARQPIEADLFPGIIEGLAGNLGLSPVGTVNPPHCRQEGMMRQWATALWQAAYDPSRTGQGSALSMTPVGLHLNYDMEFRSRRTGDIPQALTSPLLPSFPVLEKLRAGEPPTLPTAQQRKEADSPQSPPADEEDGADTQPHGQKMLVQFPFQKRKAAGQQETPSKESTSPLGVSSDIEDESVVTVSYDGSDNDGTSTSTGRTMPASCRKRRREDQPSDVPSTKKPADGDETTPQQEQNLPAEPTEAVLITTRNELYGKDHPHVQEIRARLLGLAPDVTPTDAQINASPRFALRPVAVEKDAPDIVTDYWMPYLQKNNRLADCPPEEFNATDGWVPLYTPEKLEEYLPAALSAFGSAKPPRLTAVVPPNFPLGIDKEFMLTSFNVRGCLRRASLMVGGKRRQIAFCPYCGVTNENAETGLNHVRKHLDVMLVCGGCHTKSVCLGQALQKHMKDNCPAVLAILGKTRGGRK